jgi:hypothetical protein
MINKQDILDRAAEWQLRPEVVEKDYVLGWLLAAVSSHLELQSLWIFKGGTCIKKTYSLREAFQGRVYYRGPLQRMPTYPRPPQPVRPGASALKAKQVTI